MYAIYAGETVEGEPQLDYINSFETEAEAVSEAEKLKENYSEIELINEASKELIWHYSAEESTADGNL